MGEFLKVFQQQMIAFTPHKHHHHHAQNPELKKLTYDWPNCCLNQLAAAGFFDFSQNFKKASCRHGSMEQYRDRPDCSLLNGVSFQLISKCLKNGWCVPCPEQENYHFISDDPKHGKTSFLSFQRMLLFRHCVMAKRVWDMGRSHEGKESRTSRFDYGD